MSFVNEKKEFYSNEGYYSDRKDTFANSQARQADKFVQELLDQRDATASAVDAKAALKEKADYLLQMTKSRAIKWLEETGQTGPTLSGK
jgi:CTP:phosphocholine cytidylyltransferase-like protein